MGTAAAEVDILAVVVAAGMAIWPDMAVVVAPSISELIRSMSQVFVPVTVR